MNKAGVGVYNKDVETYFYDLLLVNPTNHPSLDLVQQISMPPPIMEFEEELKRQGSFRGAPPSPSPSSESADFDVEMSKANSGFGIRNRAATYAFKIRTRVGSSVSQLSRIALPDKKPLGSPSARQKFLTKRKMFSSPQLPRKSTSDDSMSRNSSCSTVSDLSMDKMKWREESLREEPESTEVEDKKSHAKSANTSPVSSKRPSHKRTRSSDEVIDLKAVGIELKDIVVSERTSPEPPVSPIDWEAVGSERSNERVSGGREAGREGGRWGRGGGGEGEREGGRGEWREGGEVGRRDGRWGGGRGREGGGEGGRGGGREGGVGVRYRRE